MLANFIQLQAKNAEFIHTNRGGDITYHGPGQIVGYPILNLDYFAKGIRDYIENWKKQLSFVCIIMDLKATGSKVQQVFGSIQQSPGKPGKYVQ